MSFDNALVPRGGVFDSRTNACYLSPISSLRSSARDSNTEGLSGVSTGGPSGA